MISPLDVICGSMRSFSVKNRALTPTEFCDLSHRVIVAMYSEKMVRQLSIRLTASGVKSAG